MLKKQQSGGSSGDGDLDVVSLRDKIYQVCTMLHEMSYRAGYNLSIIESKVSMLRSKFTQVMLSKGRGDESEYSIN